MRCGTNSKHIWTLSAFRNILPFTKRYLRLFLIAGFFFSPSWIIKFHTHNILCGFRHVGECSDVHFNKSMTSTSSSKKPTAVDTIFPSRGDRRFFQWVQWRKLQLSKPHIKYRVFNGKVHVNRPLLRQCLSHCVVSYSKRMRDTKLWARPLFLRSCCSVWFHTYQ